MCICCNADNFGLGFGSGAIVGGEYIPRHFLFWWSLMKELSIFIDESGDFGEVVNTSPYYIVTFIFHDQADDISHQIKRLDKQLKECGFADEYIHTHPIIRKETPYHYFTIDERRQILNKMLRFTMACDISYFNIVVNKNEANDKFKLSARIAKELSGFVKEHLDYFQSYDNIIVYYDYGQQELSVIINTILNTQFSHVDFRNASPKRYKLLQVADFICSVELLKQKRLRNQLTKSETQFFYKPGELKKNYIKSVEKKRFKDS